MLLSGGVGGRPLSGQSGSDSPPATAAPAGAAPLRVEGDVPVPISLSRGDLLKLPRLDERVKDRGGNDVVYSGTPLAEVLRAAGMKFDPAAMPGRGADSSYVLVEAKDGYRVVFALSEVDPTLASQVVLLADTKDGQPLTPADGPWRIVVPADKRPARWVRQVTAISVHKG